MSSRETSLHARALSSTIVASTLFQSELIYRTMKKQPTTDFVISPIAIRSLLTVIGLSVVKNTHHELLLAMGIKSAHHGATEYKLCRNINRDEFVFSIHNAIFMNARLDFALSFRTICVEQYQTRIENIDFEARENAATNINRWIMEQTENRIGTRLAPEIFRPHQDNILIDIARLDGRWVKAFPKKLLKQDTFWLTPDKQINVNMMHDFCELPYGEFEDLRCTAILLPYKNIAVNLLILLPKTIDGLDKMEETMEKRRIDITTLTGGMKVRTLKLGLPKLRLESDIEMEQPLREMGIKEIFNESLDFARLLNSIAIMRIAQIKHIAAIEFNEDGTAPSSTKVSFLLSDAKHYTTVDINHPFFFAIMDHERIYFGGHIKEEDHFIE